MKIFKTIYIIIVACIIFFQMNYLEAEQEVKLVKLEISLEKSVYHKGEPILIEAKIVNYSDKRIRIEPSRIGAEIIILKFTNSNKHKESNLSKNTKEVMKEGPSLIYINSFEGVVEDKRFIFLEKDRFFGKLLDLSKHCSAFEKAGIYGIELVYTESNLPIHPKVFPKLGKYEVDMRFRVGPKIFENDLFSNWISIEVVDEKEKDR